SSFHGNENPCCLINRHFFLYFCSFRAFFFQCSKNFTCITTTHDYICSNIQIQENKISYL
uniref:Uncharacterized protein n=1 Tax=Moschus moschiferus TaxID=68415 RepID=A0A8C6EG75_MOSMO